MRSKGGSNKQGKCGMKEVGVPESERRGVTDASAERTKKAWVGPRTDVHGKGDKKVVEIREDEGG